MKWIDKQAMIDGVFAGTWLNAGSAIGAEIAGLSGFDWALIDLEHGSGTLKDLYPQLLALAPSCTAPIVRVPAVDAAIFKEILDLGPAGLMIPDVESAEVAQKIVRYAHIPPAGVRGAATSTRASGYGLTYKQYLQECNQSLVLMVQIESREGLRCVDAIAATDGIDVLFVGPTDLSIALGVPSDVNDKNFRGALAEVAGAAKSHGKPCGVLVRRAEEIEAYRELGYTVLTFGTDRSMLKSGLGKALQTLRAASIPS